MKFILEIDCDNSAFWTSGNKEHQVFVVEELQYIINQATNTYSSHEAPEDLLKYRNLRDSNGNTVGKAEFIESND